MSLSNRRLLRACRTTHITSYDNGSSFSSTQGGTTYIDFNDGTALALPQNGPLREEPNHDEQPVTAAPALTAAAAPGSPAQSAAVFPLDDAHAKAMTSPVAATEPTVALIHTGFAAADIPLSQAYGRAARNAVLGTRGPKMMGWFLDKVLVYDPASPPGLLRKTKGLISASAFFLDSSQQRRVKEVWRCRVCDALRTTDPNITNNLQKHTRKECKAKENQTTSSS
ncbi:hypothetical protein V8E36_001498 [Tilletia maclaganii]